MITSQQCKIWLLICFFFLGACQVPTTVESSKLQVQSTKETESTHPELSATELKEAQQRLRVGKKDSLKLLHDQQGRVVSWMVVYNPPLREEKPNSEISEFGIKDLYAFQDLAPGNNYYVILAEVHQPKNISFEAYNAWYRFTPGQYGGNREHPDRWISDEGCRPAYKFSLNGQAGGEVGEQRYTPGTFFFSRFAWGGGDFTHRMEPYEVKFKVPSQLLQAFVNKQSGTLNISVNKGGACDGTSPAFSFQETQTKPITDPSYYCDLSVQRNNIDPIERNLRSYEAEIKFLEKLVREDVFSTQGYFQPQVSHKPQISETSSFSVKSNNSIPAHCLPTPDPSSSYDPYDDGGSGNGGNVTNIHFHTKVPIQNPKSQLELLNLLAEDLKVRLTSLHAEYAQLTDDNIKNAYLKLIRDIQAGIQAAVNTLTSVKSNLTYMCQDDNPSDCLPDPEIEVIHAGFNPDSSMTIYGRVNHTGEDVDYQLLKPDFFGDIEVLADPVVTHDEQGFFKMELSNIRVSDQFYTRLESISQNVLTFPEVKVQVSYADFQAQRVTRTPTLRPPTSVNGERVFPIPGSPPNLQNLGHSDKLYIDLGFFFSDVYLNGELIATCEGDLQKCKSILEAMGYDVATLRKRDSFASRYFQDNAVRTGGWLIKTSVRPEINTLKLPGKPLLIPPNSVVPGQSHHMLIRFINEARNQANNFAHTYFIGIVQEALTKWHLEPTFSQLDVNVRLGGFQYGSNVEFDNLIYIAGNPNADNVRPIKVLGDLESKLHSTPFRATYAMYARYQHLRVMKKNKTVFSIGSNKYYIAELPDPRNYLFMVSRSKDQVQLHSAYMNKQPFILPDPSVDSGTAALSFAEWQRLYPVLFLRLPETSDTVNAIALEYKQIYGY